MKILAISHGALLNVNQFLYEELTRKGHLINLIVPKTWSSGGLGKNHTWQENKNIKITACETYFTGNGSLYFLKESLTKLIEEFGPDVIFLDEEPWSFMALQALLVLRKFKHIKLIPYTKQNIYKRYPLPFRMIEKWVYRRSSSILSIGEECTEVLRQKGYQGPALTFPHAVDLNLFDYDSLKNRENNNLKIGYIGRFVEAKGGEELIRAIDILTAKNLNVELTFMGGGESEEAWRQIVKELGLEDRIFFKEALSHLEIPRGYKSFDIVCLPSRTTSSWKEQFGRVIIEAAAIGRPVIGSDSGEIPNVINSLGNGLVFKERSSESLALAIEKFIECPELLAKFSEDGRRKVEELYSYQAIGELFCSNLSKLR